VNPGERLHVARDNRIIAARKKGILLQVIADEHGITRERVRQILKNRANVTGWIRPKGFHTYVEKRAIRQATRPLEPCQFPECHNLIGSSIRRKYCEEHTHWGEHHSYWKLWNAEQQARHKKRVLAWQAAHPEAHRRVVARSHARWWAKLSVAERQERNRRHYLQKKARRLTSKAVHATLDKAQKIGGEHPNGIIG
jgi:hypothetical protein